MNKTNDFKYNLPAYSDPVDIEDLNDNFRGIDDALMAGLCKKDYTGNNMGSSDPSARKYAWAPWLEIVNDNEFDVVVTDRNAPVGSEEATINIAAGQTFRKYINGRYYMNFYVQDQHDVTFKWFTNAETYINESGGGGGGTGTVTSVSVQGGSGSHLTGSGNPIETSGTITINVDDGYSIPSDDEQTAWDGKAADLKLEINSSTYVITAQLKDASGNLIGNERTIDLPLESVVVSGTYDDQTKKVILTLQNGSTIEFSVADLVSGLQTELSASNKLDPDYIDYDSSHRAVSDTEKDTWNGKQNALTFDDTPTQNSNNPVKSGGIYTALAGKQASLDSTQLAAVNSGINSSKVGQISTNQTNILYTLNRTGKNCMDLQNPYMVRANQGQQTYTNGDNGSVTITETNTTWSTYQVIGYVKPNTAYKLVTYVSNYSSSAALFVKESLTSETNLAIGSIQDNGTITTDITTGSSNQIRICYNLNNSATAKSNSITLRAMLVEASTYAIDSTYVVASLPNYDLTRLEAEDRASLAEVVDSGAKNELQPTWTTQTINGVTFTVGSDGVITATTTGTRTSAAIYPLLSRYSGTKMTGKVMSISPKGGTNASYYVAAEQADSPWHNVGTDYGDGVVISSEANNKDINVNIVIPANYSPNNLKFQPMVCTKAAFGVSSKFVPYRPNYDLVCKYIPESKYIDLNVTSEYSLITACTVTYPENGIYRLTASQMYYNAEPRGILITDSSTDYSEYHLMCKYETSVRENIITTSITGFATGGKTVYVFAKARSTGNNRITITLERLG